MTLVVPLSLTDQHGHWVVVCVEGKERRVVVYDSWEKTYISGENDRIRRRGGRYSSSRYGFLIEVRFPSQTFSTRLNSILDSPKYMECFGEMLGRS